MVSRMIPVSPSVLAMSVAIVLAATCTGHAQQLQPVPQPQESQPQAANPSSDRGEIAQLRDQLQQMQQQLTEVTRRLDALTSRMDRTQKRSPEKNVGDRKGQFRNEASKDESVNKEDDENRLQTLQQFQQAMQQAAREGRGEDLQDLVQKMQAWQRKSAFGNETAQQIHKRSLQQAREKIERIRQQLAERDPAAQQEEGLLPTEMDAEIRERIEKMMDDLDLDPQTRLNIQIFRGPGEEDVRIEQSRGTSNAKDDLRAMQKQLEQRERELSQLKAKIEALKSEP